MSIVRALAPAAAATLLWAAWPAAAAEPPRLSPEAAAAFRGLEEAAERLARARVAMAAIEAHERPKGAAADWAGAVEAAVGAAQALKKLDPPPLSDPADFVVTPEQLRSCATRAATLNRVERLVRTLQAEGLRLAELRSYLRERQALAQRADEARRALLKADRGADHPLVDDYFTWRWGDLERPLFAALASLQADLRRWQDRLERGQGELRARAASLGGQVGDWGRARDCALAGQWVGSRTQDGAVSSLALRLVAQENGWSGTLTLGGAALPVRSVKLRGASLQVSAGERRVSLSGSLSADDRTLKGSLSSADGPATFSLRKQ